MLQEGGSKPGVLPSETSSPLPLDKFDPHIAQEAVTRDWSYRPAAILNLRSK
ncbi:MAG: hypothetical protein UT57_C0061G0002 [Microgenomates group bacterium GW2011_GWC1_39_7]|nr:MAG: hypothetical protein UT57_C0061G0002 [Microgenomates group bacterium GW2011_GWC1_39_7]